MKALRSTHLQIILMIACLTVVVIFLRVTFFRAGNTEQIINFFAVADIARKSKQEQTERYTFYKHPSVTLVDMAVRDPGYQTIPCVNVTVDPFYFPLCTYPAAIDIVSKWILTRKSLYFETGILSMIKPLEKDADLVFMDLGVHMGFFSVPAALKGHQVLAVEANPVTARIVRKTFVLANITHMVTLVQNGLSNKRMRMMLGSNVPNRASTFLLGRKDCPKGEKCLDEAVNTIFLDDLIPFMKSDRAIMKVDIQGSEIDCFTEATASKFFSIIDVPLMRIEWDMYKNSFPRTKSYKKSQIEEWLPFFYKRNYTVHDPKTGKKLGPDWTKWPYDVVFKRPYRNMGLL